MRRILLIGLIGLMLGGCGYRGSLLIKDNEIIAKSNKPMCIEKKINKDGVTTYTYSSKKSASWMENLMTIIGLRATNK